jgi:hypothetical protein
MEYILVEPRRVWAGVYRRMPGGVWTEAVYDIDETLDIRTVRISIPVARCTPERGRLVNI